MTRLYEAAKTSLAFLLIFGVVVVWPWLNTKAVSNCQAINEGRREARARAYVIREFLEIAAAARQHTGSLELAKSPRQAAVDLATAEKYRELEILIHNLPIRNC